MFNSLADGGFCPSSYRRLDNPPNRASDGDLIEEAIVLFAEAVAAAGPNWVNGGGEADSRGRRHPPRFSHDDIRAP